MMLVCSVDLKFCYTETTTSMWVWNNMIRIIEKSQNSPIWMNYPFKLLTAVTHQSPGSCWRTSNWDSTFSVNSHLCGLITVSLNLMLLNGASRFFFEKIKVDDKRLFMTFKEREKGGVCSFTSATFGLNEIHMLGTLRTKLSRNTTENTL